MIAMDMEAETSAQEERALGYRDYVQALEEERKKIQVFHRELPLSLHLVTQAIESCRLRMTAGGCRSEIDEGETSSEGGPVLEFIPIKRKSSSAGGHEQELGQRHQEEDSFSTTRIKNSDFSGKKPDWLQAVQLWNPIPDSHHDEDDDTCRQTFVADRSKGSSAFHPFLPRKASSILAAGELAAPPPQVKATPAVSCTSDGRDGKGEGDDKESHPLRKARRCWSPELHRRFLDALQQLGGSHVATPKQIRDLMKVDGLTNDEVKSHLQKFRLHSRRPTSSVCHGGAANAPPQQVVFLGGLWMPPPEYAAAAAAAAAAAVAHAPPAGPQIYAPVASLPVLAQKQDPAKQSPKSLSLSPPNGCSGLREERRRDADGGMRSNSATTSSSSDTTSASHFNRDNALQSC